MHYISTVVDSDYTSEMGEFITTGTFPLSHS